MTAKSILLSVPENIDNPEAKGYVELNLLSDWVQEKHHTIQPPTLSEAIKLRIHKRGLSQKALSQYLGLNVIKFSKYIQGFLKSINLFTPC